MARKAGKAGKSAGADQDAMIMHPKTRMVDLPGWDKQAPEIEVVGLNERKRKPTPAKKKKASTPTRAPTGEPDETSRRLLVILAFTTVAFAGVAFALNYLLNSEAENTGARARKAASASPGAGETGATDPTEASAEEPAAEADRSDLERMYRGHVVTTATELGVDAPSTEDLRKPRVFANPISHGNPKVIGPNKSMRQGPLSLRVKIVPALSVDRIKVSSKGNHTLLIVENKGEVPIAYRLLARKFAGAKCLTPAIIKYDAIVLDPGQRVEISICSGRQSVEIIDLRTYELTMLGAVWVRQLPPGAVGLTGLTAKSHEVAEGTPQCTEDEEWLQRALYEGELAWEDVIDFYSRHDCTHYPWPSDYQFRDGQGPDELPVVAPWNPGASPYDADDESPKF